MVTQDEREFWSHTSAGRPNEAGFDRDWPAQPGALADAPTTPTLPAEMIPDVLRPWLVEVARRACFNLEFVAVPAIGGAGAVIGRSVGIMPGKFDDFLVVPNLWGAIVARPGLMKSYAVDEGLRPLHRLAGGAVKRFAEVSASQSARQVRLHAEMEALKSAAGDRRYDRR